MESLWERLDIPVMEQQKVLGMIESFRPRDIQVVSNNVVCCPELSCFNGTAERGETETG